MLLRRSSGRGLCACRPTNLQSSYSSLGVFQCRGRSVTSACIFTHTFTPTCWPQHPACSGRGAEHQLIAGIMRCPLYSWRSWTFWEHHSSRWSSARHAESMSPVRPAPSEAQLRGNDDQSSAVRRLKELSGPPAVQKIPSKTTSSSSERCCTAPLVLPVLCQPPATPDDGHKFDR